MKIEYVNDSLKKLFIYSIIRNELGGDISLAYEFSDPDGVRTGKSGWSFGICQFDINNNPNAILCLRECGFTTDEIKGLKDQTIDIWSMNEKLDLHRQIVDIWDGKQVMECLSWPLTLCNESKIDFQKLETFIHIADYHNQFYMSRNGKFHTWLKSMNTPITPEMIRDFKLSLPWGKKAPQDVLRRYDNIAKIVSRSAAQG